MKKHKKLKLVLSSILLVLCFLVILFFSYFGSYYKGSTGVDTYLESNSNVTVIEHKEYYEFKCTTETDYGFIFYPGAKVETKAYAPLCMELAEKGINVYLVDMPLYFAIFGKSRANTVLKDHPELNHVYIGGHSLGGAMAGNYLKDQYSKYEGLVLLASYVTNDLSSTNLKTLSIYGDNDKVMNATKYEKNKTNLPALEESVIVGGNHGYMGDYGYQKDDGEPSITVEEQRTFVVNKLYHFIKG